MSTRMAEPFPLGLSLLAVDDVRRAVLEEVHAAALCQLKAVSTAWCTHARRELCTRLCRYEGDGITDVDVECLNDAGRPWEVVIAGRQLPQLARLRGFSFVVDVQAVRGADLREADRGAAARDAPLGCLALSGCIEGEGDPPRELLLAAVACAASGWALGVPVQELREDKDYGLSCRGLGVIGVGLLALTLPGATSLRSLRCRSDNDRGRSPANSQGSCLRASPPQTYRLSCQRPLTSLLSPTSPHLCQLGTQPALRPQRHDLHRRGHHQAVRGARRERRDLAKVRRPERSILCQRSLTLLCLLPPGSLTTVLVGTTTRITTLLPTRRASPSCPRRSREAQ